MRERDLQRKLIKELNKLGLAFSFNAGPLTIKGMPDVFFLRKGAMIKFIEVKQDDGELSEIQTHRLHQLRDLGFECHVLYGMDDIRQFIEKERGL